MYGVLYHRDPLILFDKLRHGHYNLSEYILLHGENQSEWKQLLDKKMIDPNRVEGININNLESFGAIVPNPVPEFTLEEVFYVMAKSHPFSTGDLKDALIRIDREPSTPVMLKYVYCRNKFVEELGKNKFPLTKMEEPK